MTKNTTAENNKHLRRRKVLQRNGAPFPYIGEPAFEAASERNARKMFREMRRRAAAGEEIVEPAKPRKYVSRRKVSLPVLNLPEVVDDA